MFVTPTLNETASRPHGPSPFAARQAVVLVGLGLGFWLLIALFVRWGAPLGLFDGLARLALFAIAVPVAGGMIWAAVRAARLRPHQVVPEVALVSGVAALCDGVALTWAPGLYGAGARGPRDGRGLDPVGLRGGPRRVLRRRACLRVGGRAAPRGSCAPGFLRSGSSRPPPRRTRA